MSTTANILNNSGTGTIRHIHFDKGVSNYQKVFKKFQIYFELDYNFLKKITQGEKITKDFYEKHLNHKKECLIERLINMKKSFMEKYKTEKISDIRRKIENEKIIEEASSKAKISNLTNGKFPPGNTLTSIDVIKTEEKDERNINNNSSNLINKKPIDKRLAYIKNLQELREQNDKADMILKAYLSPKRKVKKQKVKKNKEEIEKETLNITYEKLSKNPGKDISSNLDKENFNLLKNNIENGTTLNLVNIVNFNNYAKKKTSFDFLEKTNYNPTTNKNSYPIKGAFFCTNLPIFKVDYSHNFKDTNFNNRYTTNTFNTHSSFNNNNSKKMNSKSFSNQTSTANFQEGNFASNINTFRESNSKNLIISTDNKFDKNKNYTKDYDNTNSIFYNSSNMNNLHQTTKILPSINGEYQTTYLPNFKAKKMNDNFTPNNNNLKKILNRASNFNPRSFSNRNLKVSITSENNYKLNNFNTNFSTTKNYMNNFDTINYASKSNNNLFESPKNNKNYNFSYNENTESSKKIHSKQMHFEMNPTVSSEGTEVLGNLFKFNKYELRLEEIIKEDHDYNQNYLDEKENIKKPFNMKFNLNNTFNNDSYAKEFNKLTNKNKNNNLNEVCKIKIFDSNSFDIKSNEYNCINNNDHYKTTVNKLPKFKKTAFKNYDYLKGEGKTSKKISRTIYANKLYTYSDGSKNNSLEKNTKLTVKDYNHIKSNISKINFENNYTYNTDNLEENSNEANQKNILNSTKEIFHKANTLQTSSKQKKKLKKKFLLFKYNINTNNTGQNFKNHQYLDENDVCRLLENNLIKLNEIDKLNLIPNFNNSYFNKLLNNTQINKFNNPLLEGFKPKNYDNEYNVVVINEGGNKKHENLAEVDVELIKDENQINNNNNNILYKETETNWNENITMREIFDDMNNNFTSRKDQKSEVNEKIIKEEKIENHFNKKNLDNEKESICKIFTPIQNNRDINTENNYNSKGDNYYVNNFNDDLNLNNIRHVFFNENEKSTSENEQVGECMGLRINNQNTNNQNVHSEKIVMNTINSDNYLNNTGNSTIDNMNKINIDNKIPENIYYEEVIQERIPYNWGTKFSNVYIAQKGFINLSNNFSNDYELKERLLSDVIVDQQKLSDKRKEQFIIKKESHALARTQKIFSKFIQKRKSHN